MKVFKIPKFSKEGQCTKAGIVIGVIDASGSMQSVWAWLATFWNQCIPTDNLYTITFDTTAKICESNILDTSISKHGGGGTNITVAFEKMEEKLKILPLGTPVTVLFISDGQDNNLDTIEQRFTQLKGNPGHIINFICLGVGAGFPTFISMRSRELYHNGQADSPAIFLIEYPSEKAFFNKFESMKQFFTHNKRVPIKPPVCVFPWEEPQIEAYENTWILTEAEEIKVEDKAIDLTAKDYLQLDGVSELFRGWVQAIHLESLKGDIKERAQKTLKVMQNIVDYVKKEKNINLLELKDLDPSAEGLTFGQRAFRNYLKYNVSRVEWYYGEIKLLAEGKSPKELSEFDAAKRIGIGTITGKYQQKVLALKNITAEEFQKIRDGFEQTFKYIKLNPNSSQKGSIFTTRNQREVFLEKDFLEGLKICNSQFDLVGSFPMIGLAIKIKRFNGSNVNPWLTEVRFVAEHGEAIDTLEIIKSNNQHSLKTEKEMVENINAVLPLFNKSDDDLKPLITSRLYHLLMNFNVMQNFDTLCEDAYLALLANTLLYLFQQEKSEWREDLFKLIDSTVRITYYDQPEFIKYRESLAQDPAAAIINDTDQNKYGSIDLSKAILHLCFLIKDQLIDKFTTKEVIEAIFLKWIFQLVKNKDAKISSYFKMKNFTKLIEEVIKIVREQFSKFVTMGDLRREVYDTMDKLLVNVNLYEFEWDISEFYKIEDKVNLKTLEPLYEILLGSKPTKEDYIRWITRAYHAPTYEELFKPASKNLNSDAVTEIIVKKVIAEVQEGFGVKQLPQCKDAIQALEKEFVEWFKLIHREVIPISGEDLKKHCEKEKVDYYKYSFATDGLLINACLAQGCPHYLKINDRLSSHIAIWPYEDLPRTFHFTVRSYCYSSPETVYKRLPFTAEKYGVSKEFVLNYIAKVQKVYQKM